ncbi:MAG: hypothetical protein ABL961_03030 [Vicinamibacterales bacterium]
MRACGPLLVVALLVLPLTGAACARVHPETFAPLAQTGQSIVVALTDRPTLPRFRPLRQAFGSALAEARPKARSSTEHRMLNAYEAVDERLSEMLAVWEGLNARQEERLPVTRPLGAQLKARYDLAVNTNEPVSIYATEALVALRDDIKERLGHASGKVRVGDASHAK